MPFPANGPTTKDLVKAHLGITDDVDDAAITAAVDAVNSMVTSWPVAQVANTDPAPASWDAFSRVVHGSTLLAARLFRRRNSPDGVTSLGDGSPAYIARTDPDVAQLLQIGTNTAPGVG
jgi:hypothetical protein